MNHWRDDLSNDLYHKEKEYVSSTPLKLLIESTPDVYEDQYILGNSKPSSDAMNLSSLVHHGLLEGYDFIKRYAVKPKYDMRTNQGKLDSAKWDKDHLGKIKVTEDELAVIQGTYKSVMKHADARTLLSGCMFEKSGFYTDPETGIKCRIRYDAYDPNDKVLVDIKAVRDASPRAFRRAIEDYRWDLSMAMYGQGIFEIDDSRVEQFVFIAVEKTRPYRCAVYELGPKSLEKGRSDYHKALQILKDCRANNAYPSLQQRYETLELSPWFLAGENAEG